MQLQLNQPSIMQIQDNIKNQQISSHVHYQEYFSRNKTKIFKDIYNSDLIQMKRDERTKQEKIKEQIKRFDLLQNQNLYHEFLTLWKQKHLLSFFVLNNQDFKSKKSFIMQQLLQIISDQNHKKHQVKYVKQVCSLSDDFDLISQNKSQKDQANNNKNENPSTNQSDIYQTCLKWIIQNEVIQCITKQEVKSSIQKLKNQINRYKNVITRLLIVLLVILIVLALLATAK